MVNYQPLARLLNCDRSNNLPLALVNGEFKTWGDWRERVDAWRSVIRRSSGEMWALYHNDSFEFSAILFALWAEHRIACIPGSNQKVIVEKLREHVDGFVGEFSHCDNNTLLSAPIPSLQDHAEPLPPIELNNNKKVLEIFTSGSSGEPQAIEKRLFQISNEIDNLQRLWSRYTDNAVIFSTVSHHHIYGMLFKIFWPLAAGLRFDSSSCEYLEDIMQRLSLDQRFILISSPTHLSRIPDRDYWAKLAKQCAAIFSSGAPLPQAASMDTQRYLNFTPIEVFGSSETGGIAYRQQAAEKDVLWQPIPGLTVSLDQETQCLQIQSPYLAPMRTYEWYVTTDRARIVGDGQFQLLGRIDNIVKVEGKRISTTAMEQRLASHNWVDKVKLVVLQGKRSELGAVVLLTELGNEMLKELGKRQVNLTLRNHLLDEFERPVIPRRWRFPKQLPFNPQGKLPQNQLIALFAKHGSNAPKEAQAQTSKPENYQREKQA